ncbi:MAG: transposase [Chloroflexi bacterium]|nr:transposase [Chloroflexota bacterium]
MPDQLYPDRKKIRLDPRIYAVQGTICSITVCSADRAAVFSDSALAEGCITLLVSRAEVTEVAIHAYCFMPDHVHLLMSPSSTVSIVDFVRDFKSRSTRLAWQYGYKGAIWQTSYHDRFLRKDDDVQVAVEYILNNPVRRGIVAEWRQYPFCGSLVCEL